MIKSVSRSGMTFNEKHRSLSAGNLPSAEYLVSTQVLSEGTASATFDISSLHDLYKSLKIVISSRTNRSPETTDWIKMQFNGVTTNSYSSHDMFGKVTAPGSRRIEIYNCISISNSCPTSANTANVFGASVVDIINFGNDTKNTVVKNISYDSDYITIGSSTFLSTAKINTILIAPMFGSTLTFAAGTRISLYGATA